MLPYFEVHDRGRGPYLLLLHGMLSSRAQWRLNIDALAEVARPVVVEVLGHGRSPAPDDPEPYRMDAYIAGFEAIRRELDADRVVVCGQSFGAGITIRYALRYPERVMGLVFTNSNSALAPKSPETEARREQRARAIEEGGRAALEAERIHPRHGRHLPEAVRRELLADAELLSPAGVAKCIRVTGPDLSVVDDLGALRVPAMLINGYREQRFQPLRDRAAAALPGGRVVDLDGGHGVNIHAADAFNATVAGFIAQLAA